MRKVLGVVGLVVLAGCGTGAVDGANNVADDSADVTHVCSDYAPPDTPATCHCAAGETCAANNCYGGKWCHLTTNRCVLPPTDCGGSGSTGGSTTGSTSGGSTGSTTGSVGVHGGSVTLMHFAVSGDTRPPSCEDTADYPTAIIDSIGQSERNAGAQFALDLGDHMYVCNDSLSTAQAQMNLFMQGVSKFGGTWFMTEGNHECMGSYSNSGSCTPGTTNSNFKVFLSALAPISSTPYYSVDVQTSKGLATFVFIADNSWDSTEKSWLESTLTRADANATYTIIAKHHPQSDSSISANATIMQVIRAHKFALLLTGHSHRYAHETADNGRDLILGNGGAPLASGGTFNGYAMVDQMSDGHLQVTVYDLATGQAQDVWSVGPNN